MNQLNKLTKLHVVYANNYSNMMKTQFLLLVFSHSARSKQICI